MRPALSGRIDALCWTVLNADVDISSRNAGWGLGARAVLGRFWHHSVVAEEQAQSQVQNALVVAADLLDEAAHRAHQLLYETPASGFESHFEARMVAVMNVRHAEAIALLSRQGERTLSAALVVARAAYEAAGGVIWLLAPDDPFTRESRWVARMRQAARQEERIEQSLNGPRGLAEDLRSFSDRVAALLPGKGVAEIPEHPSARGLLDNSYGAYQELCRFTHADSGAVQHLYRENLGVDAIYREKSRPDLWALVLRVILWSLGAPLERYLEVEGVDQPRQSWSRDGLVDNMNQAIVALKALRP